MALPFPTEHPLLLEEQFERRLFTRRNDLTNAMRFIIATDALHAMANNVWGTITHLADTYKISRPFVYSLAAALKEAGEFLFSETAESVTAMSLREYSLQVMLSLRLEARGSIGAISTIMKRFGCELSATGSVSQVLSSIGNSLPDTLSTENGATQYLVFASDEIFSKTTPILVTVDPSSSAILRIELADSRKAEDWKRHFECLYDNGLEMIYLVSDEGQGIRAGHADMSDTVRQSDTYHAIAHQLGSWMDRLEKAAYKAIGVEYDCEKKLDSAKSDRVLEKRWANCESASDAAQKAVMLYDDLSYLYRSALCELNVFDNSGNLRDREQAEDGIKVGLALVKGLNHNDITKAANKAERTLPDLLHYFDVRKAKKSVRKKKAQKRDRFCLEIAEGLHQDESMDYQKEIYSRLDKIVQSSALVECINSIIRPYFNTTKNHVTQGLLNLIMHHHNHRRYLDGVRKNKTPMELLTGKAQAKDWISMLFDKIREKDPELLLAS